MRKLICAFGILAALVLLLTLLLVAIRTILVNKTSNRQLKMVHIVMRHGARTPVATYPNDPYKNHSMHPVGWGYLTNHGKKTSYEMGKYYRERYDKFLGDTYSPDEYYAQTTDFDRVQATALLINAALWPPKGNQVWGPLEWQPIPVYSEPLPEDSLLLVTRNCPKYTIERQKVFQSEEVQDMFKQHEYLFKELTDITGLEINEFVAIRDIFTTLKAEEEFELELPDWTKDYYPDKMFFPAIKGFVLNAYNDEMNRFKGGVLVKKLIEDWTAKAEAKTKMRTVLYVAHDSTIVNLMRALKVWDEQFPDYGIATLLELSQDMTTNEYGIEIYLRNSTEVPPFKLTIPGCESFCPLNKFIALTTNIIPVNWEEECQQININTEFKILYKSEYQLSYS